MAMGIFEQLAWLTTKVNRLCCAIVGIKTGGLKMTTIDMNTPPDPIIITEGGLYNFINGTGAITDLYINIPTYAGQTLYIINSSANSFSVAGDFITNERPYEGGTAIGVISIASTELWQFLSVENDPLFTTGFGWRGSRLYL